MSRIKRILKITFIVIFAVLMLLLTVYINHQIRLNAEAGLRLPLGQMVEVDGHNMSIYVEGTGDTTLIFMYQNRSGRSRTECALRSLSPLHVRS